MGNGVGPSFEAVAGTLRGPTDGTCGTGELAGLGPNTVTSGFDGPWTRTPSRWSHDYFDATFNEEWEPTTSLFGNDQWQTKNRASTFAKVRRLTADLSLIADPIYKKIAQEYLANPSLLDSDFAAAWYKLVHRSTNHPHENDLEKDVGLCVDFDYMLNDYSPTCFPGEATVQIEGAGQSPIADLRVGDRVLAAQGYETVLGFLHHQHGGSNKYLTVSHSDGEFRATANHLVFTPAGSTAVGDLRVGEQIFVSASAPPSRILEVRESTSSLGVFSPFTASGTVVVDDAVVSIYGQPSPRAKLTHGSAHAAFFLVRVYHALGLTGFFGEPQTVQEIHPFARALLPLQHLISK